MKIRQNHSVSVILLLAAILLIKSTGLANAETHDFDLPAAITDSRIFLQPVIWMGEVPPSRQESEALWEAIQTFSTQGVAAGLANLETFVGRYPNSAWAPSLRSNLGEYYRDHGRYSLALQHWEQAWSSTKTNTNGNAKKIADSTLVRYTRLLASLGRHEILKTIFQETSGRLLDAGPLQQVFNGTKDGFNNMTKKPGISYRCGTFALFHVGATLNRTNLNMKKLLEQQSPDSGFSMEHLLGYAANFGIPLTAAKRVEGEELIVPSVVHWKEHHYAAIVAQKGDYYRVIDPTFGKAKWLHRDVINAESSGHYLIPTEQLPKGWQILSTEVAKRIYGKGAPNNIDDQDDEDCPTDEDTDEDSCTQCSAGSSPPGGPPGGGPPGGGPSGQCGRCAGNTPPRGVAALPPEGMPVWRVTEPYITLWLNDIPFSYWTSDGKPFAFKLSYKQRNTRTTDNTFGVGKLWECSWLSLVQTDAGIPQDATQYVMGGGERAYASDGVTREYKSRSRMTNYVNGSGKEIYQVSYPTGSKNHYGYQFGYGIGVTNRFLSSKIDVKGRTTSFYYETTNSAVRLTHVVDSDGRTNTLNYTNASFPNLITSARSPHGQEAFLQYDHDGRLTNIVDAVGLTNAIVYDPTDSFVTNLVTPYGVTRFQTTSNGFDGYDLSGNDEVNRSILVTEPDGGHHLYFYRDASKLVHPSSTNELIFADQQPSFWEYYATNVPVTAPLSNTFENSYWNHARNSYYIGPRQYALLDSAFRSSLSGAYDLTAFYNMTLADYYHARIRHWLHQGNDYYRVGQTLSLERTPSPDGVTPGQKIWYDYADKAYDVDDDNLFEGNSRLPLFVAQVLPDGTTSFAYTERNEWGHPTNVINTYTLSDGTVGLRTNLYTYDETGKDLISHIGPDGITHESYFYNASHQVLRMTNALNEVTHYTYDGEGHLTSIKSPAGLTTTNYYYASGLNQGYLEKTIDLEIARTNSFTYTNGLVYSHTNERGLTITNTWDALQRLRRVTYPDGTFITNSYDKLDLTQVVDRMGYTNSFGYDAMRRMVAQTNALGRYSLYGYCACGSLDSMQDAGGNITSYYYDNVGQLLRTVYSDTYSVTNHYNLIGQITNTTDSAGSSTTNWFNNQGLLVTSSNVFGQLLHYTFDLEDRITNSVDAAGVTIASAYDDLGRLLIRTYPDSGMERFGYSARGLVAYTNQIDHTNFYAYDEARRKTHETNANWEITQFRYDSSGNLTNLLDGKNQNTWWRYDEYSRVTNKLDDASNLVFAYGYDRNNRLTNRWTPAKGTTIYRYDPVGNLTNVDYSVSADLALQYDVLDRLTNLVDAVGTTRYDYNSVGQLLSEAGPWSDDTVSYTYQNRLRSGVSLAAPNASPWTLSYEYDAMKRLTNVTSAAGGFGYQYQASWPSTVVTRLDLPSGSFITNTHDSVSRLLATELKTPLLATLNGHFYDYNPGHQRTNQTRIGQVYTNGSWYLATNEVAYGYDPSGQLQTAEGREANGNTRLSEQFGYQYDAAGNLTNRVQNLFTNTFNLNSLNQLTTVHRFGNLTVAGTTTARATNVTVNSLEALLYDDTLFARTNVSLSDGDNTFTAIARDSRGRADTNSVTVYLPATLTCEYDLNGNLRTNGNRVLEYDDENQLTAVTVSNAWRSEFTYDGQMRRRIRKEFTWQSSNWVKTNEVRYLYDGNLVIQERDANNLPQVTYTRGNDLSGSMEGAGGIGGLLARTGMSSTINAQPSTAFYHGDGNGNVTCLINTNHIIVAKYLYDPFGNTLSASGPLAEANLYRFSSKELHQNSGLVYYLYRHYAANLQRWLNRDPIMEKGGINLYAFVLNKPVDRFDPYGWSSAAECRQARDDCKQREEKEADRHRQCLGQAYNNLKRNADLTRQGMDDLCDLQFPNVNSFSNINCKNAAAVATGAAKASLLAGYNAAIATVYAAEGLAKSSCQALYVGCLLSSWSGGPPATNPTGPIP